MYIENAKYGLLIETLEHNCSHNSSDNIPKFKDNWMILNLTTSQTS